MGIVKVLGFSTVLAVICIGPRAVLAQGHRGGGHAGGGRAVAGGHVTASTRVPVVSHAVPRTAPVHVAPYTAHAARVAPHFAVGVGIAYGHPRAVYGYPGYSYSAYGYPAYGYPSYGYGAPAYGYPASGYSGRPYAVAYGGVRIVGAPRNAAVYVDGYYVGIVNNYDGIFQHAHIEEGPHRLEIQAPGYPPTAVDIYVRPGQTMTYRADIHP